MGKENTVIQPTGFTRRQFLYLLGIGGGALAVERILGKKEIDPVFKIEFDKYNEFLSFNECSQLAVRMDNLYDSLPEYKSSMTKQDLLEWAVEMIPMFEYEGIVPRARWPREEGIGFLAFPDGDSHNHVAGRSDCANYAGLNLRFANEHSAWYESDDAPFTLLHELAHIQQGQDICSTFDRSSVENSAQIAGLEVGAAMVNQGNKEMMVPLVSELRGMAISAAYAAAIRTNRVEEFIDFRAKLSPGAFADARFAKARRRWSNNPVELMTILDRYNVTPLLMISNAIRLNNAEIKGLAFPPVYDSDWANYYTSNSRPIPIKLNDLSYFLEHAEAMAKDMK
ncbi:hypothetical protein HZB78_06385 [Candidatus Collierbacteria bacterium]|nr:hypothetical protein [Candidatus Collierbacteria bacterium]